MSCSVLSSLRTGLAIGLAASVWLLSSCGGGVGSQASNTTGAGGSGVGSGGTGSYTNGPISGLGSIIVNGVRYDVSQARVLSDDGIEAAYTADDLNLGMQVEVSGDAVVAGAAGALPTASASQVRFSSSLLGPVDRPYDAACRCLDVLGQKVRIAATTVWPVDLSSGDVVEVFGQPDLTAGLLVATRVQRVTDAARPYKLVGWVSASGGVGERTLTVSGPTRSLTLSYSEASEGAALEGLGGHGRRVRVWLQRGLDAQERHVLVKLAVDAPLVSDEAEARLEGRVTALANAGTGLMGVNGEVVNVSGVMARVRNLVVGQRVRVDGSLVNGVLKVFEVSASSGGEEEEDEGEIELHGRPDPGSFVAVGGGKGTLVLRDVTVLYTLSQAPANLQSLSCVEVEGSGFNAAGQLLATHIRADDSCH